MITQTKIGLNSRSDESPYLMGFINSLKSMMSYTGKTKL